MWLACALIAFAACNDDNSTNPLPGSIAMSVASSPVTIVQGQSGTATITITRADPFSDAVSLTLEGAPAGLTASFAPATLASGATTSTLTLSPASSVAAGTYATTIRAKGAGVDDATAPLSVIVTQTPTPTFTVALSSGTMSVAQGASGSATATITRGGGFTGPVTFAVSGAPTGVTTTITPNPATGASATIAVAVGAATAPGTYNLTLTGTGAGVASQTATITLTVPAPPQSFSLALSPAAVSVTQGASATSTATITRNNGFTGAVALAVTGAPTGLTATVNPASVTGTTSTITVAPSTAVAAGTYNLTVTGTGTGVTDQTATLAVTVGTAASKSVTYNFCADNAPVWVAVQDGSGPWTRVNATTSNSYTFQFASGRGGIAYVTSASGSGSNVTVLYATSSELSGSGGTTTIPCTTGTKTVNGSVAGLGATDMATIVLGSSTASVFGAAGSNTFQLKNVPQGSHDLIASRAAMSGSAFTVNRLIIRRALDPADGSTLPVLDFGAAESFAPATANVTINNLGGDQAFTSTSLATANGSSASFAFFGPSTAATQPFYGVPTAQLIAGDLHSLFAIATPSGSTSTSRSATLYFRAVADRTVTLGSVLGSPTITTVTASPYLRLRAQLPLQSEYNQFGGIFYAQGTGGTARAVSILMTAAYAGTGPYDLTIPDLSAAAGWNNVWGLQSGVATTWNVFETGGTFGFGFPGQVASDGSVSLTASRSGSIASP